MRWNVFGETVLYDNPWIRLTQVDVEVPGVGRIDHHVVRATSAVAGTVVRDLDGQFLLMWRHRFITDEWGWEIPAGRLDPGESALEAAEREALEETGYRPTELYPLGKYYPSDGLSDQQFHLFASRGAVHEGDPSDPSESERLEWHSPAQVRELVADGAVKNGLSMTGLLLALAFGDSPNPNR